MPNAYSCDHQTLINFIYNYGKYFIYNYGILLMEDTHTCTERHDLLKKQDNRQIIVNKLCPLTSKFGCQDARLEYI